MRKNIIQYRLKGVCVF